MNSNDKPLLLLSLLFFLGTLAVFFYLITPVYSGTDGFVEKEKDYKAASAELNNLKNYHSSVTDNYEKLKKASWEKIREEVNINFLSNEPTFLPKMYSFFDQRAREAGMNLDSVSGSTNWDPKKAPAAEGSLDRLKKNQFNLSLTGSYASFKKLLLDLESQSLLTSLSKISFSNQSAVSKSGKTVLNGMPFGVELAVPSY